MEENKTVDINLDDRDLTDDEKKEMKDSDKVHIHKTDNDGEEVDISSGNEKVAFGLSQGSRLSMHRC